ncbi:MAG: hypothetical protein WC805_00515 [Patescibacteria group bacterium]|jgi:hypothetical protein
MKALVTKHRNFDITIDRDEYNTLRKSSVSGDLLLSNENGTLGEEPTGKSIKLAREVNAKESVSLKFAGTWEETKEVEVVINPDAFEYLEDTWVRAKSGASNILIQCQP